MTSILYTVFKTTEEPPADMAAFELERAEKRGLFAGALEISAFIARMPRWSWSSWVRVQFFSWFAFFTMWSFATPALTEHVFAAALPQDGVEDFNVLSAAYNEAANAVSSAMGVYGLSSMVFALLLSVWTSRRGIDQRVDTLGEPDARRGWAF